jgi:TIR domain-containing protein
MTTGRLFISHANEDAQAARIVAYLESHGVTCWISSRDIPPRAIYADVITEAMQACSACAVLITSAANRSKAVKREWPTYR